MKFIRQLGYLGLFCLFVLISYETVKADQNEKIANYDSVDFVPGQLIVGIKPNSQMSRSGLNRDVFPGIDVADVEVLLSLNTNARSTRDTSGQILLLDLVEADKQSVIAAIEILEQHPDVAYAEPDFIEQLDNSIENDQLLALTRNNNSLLWNMERIGLPGVWNITTGDSSIKVGVIDTGVDHTHPNLARNVDASLGYNFAQNTSDTLDRREGGHGTFVAGIIGAVGPNSDNMFGVAPEVTIIPLKVRDDVTGSLVSSASIRAIAYANEMGIHIINRSLGSDSHSQSLESAIRSFNGLFIASSGNNSRNTDVTPTFPASLNIPNMITVGNSTVADERHPSSNFGRESVDLFAPGVVTSTAPGNIFRTSSGTSYAAPHVAAAAVLALAVNPSLTPVELKAAMLESVDPVPALANLSVSGGRLNVERLIYQVGNFSHVDSNGNPLKFNKRYHVELRDGSRTNFSVWLRWDYVYMNSNPRQSTPIVFVPQPGNTSITRAINALEQVYIRNTQSNWDGFVYWNSSETGVGGIHLTDARRATPFRLNDRRTQLPLSFHTLTNVSTGRNADASVGISTWLNSGTPDPNQPTQQFKFIPAD